MSIDLGEFSCEASVVKMRVIEDDKISKLTTDLTFLSSNVHVRLIYYGNLCHRIKRMFEEEANNFRNRYAELGRNIDKIEDYQDREIATSRYLDQQWLFGERTEVQESAATVGIFLKVYALLEDVMNILCDMYMELTNFHTPVKDLHTREKGIVRASAYIKKLTGINNQNKVEWNKIKHWKRIRNQILHEDAKVTDSRSLKASMNALGIQSIRDTTVNSYDIINLKLDQVLDFISLTDKTLSLFVLHEDDWIKVKK